MEWYQQALTPPEVVEVRARFGMIPAVDHVQALVEVIDPTTGVQVAQWSSPHRSMTAIVAALEELCDKLKELALASVEPF